MDRQTHLFCFASYLTFFCFSLEENCMRKHRIKWRKETREKEEEEVENGGGKIVVGQSLLSLCNLVDYDQFPWYRWPPWPWATLPPALCMVRALCTMTWLTLHLTIPIMQSLHPGLEKYQQLGSSRVIIKQSKKNTNVSTSMFSQSL